MWHMDLGGLDRVLTLRETPGIIIRSNVMLQSRDAPRRQVLVMFSDGMDLMVVNIRRSILRAKGR